MSSILGEPKYACARGITETKSGLFYFERRRNPGTEDYDIDHLSQYDGDFDGV
jgi:hypothetical protein